LFEDSRHNLWFATEGGGLIRLDPDRRHFKRYTTKNGLPTNYVYRVLEDNEGKLWASSLRGLICLDPKTEKVKVYTRANGLITDQFNYNSAFKDGNGKMYFGTVKGMIAFNPAKLNKTLASPTTYITGFQVKNQDITPNTPASPLKKSILFTDTITLTNDQSSFNIEFAAFNYASSAAIQYKYLMKGIDMKDWTFLKNNQRAYFTDLSPGTYTFLVKAESNVGTWESKERVLVIKIRPPLWRSPAAYVVYAILFVLAIYFSVTYYHRYQEGKHRRKMQLFEFEKEKEIYQAKIEFFTNMTHEIQTPLTLIKGPIEWAMKKAEDNPSIKRSLQKVEKNTNRLLELTAQLLDFRKTEMDQFGLNFVKLNINQVLKQETEVFEFEAANKNIRFETKLPKEQLIAFVDYEAFNKIISNLLSNAIKYSSSVVKLELVPIKAAETDFTILVSNDGKPIPSEFSEKIFEPFFRMKDTSEKPGTGIGLPIARSLAELHNGSLKLVEHTGGWIVFKLMLPIHHSIEFNLSKWKKLPAYE
jgi:signal transduction histidine kinase